MCRSSRSRTRSAGRSRKPTGWRPCRTACRRTCSAAAGAAALPRLPRQDLAEKRVDRAIGIAERCGLPLRIAAKVDRADQDYFDETIKPLLSKPCVEYIGEIGDEQKSEFLSGAIALLVPIDWPEPFGLVMIEAMACGAPVIAFNRGSVSEIVEDGVTGFVVEDETSAAGAVRDLASLSRKEVRRRFEERFTARRMAEDYVRLYRSMIDDEQGVRRAAAD